MRYNIFRTTERRGLLQSPLQDEEQRQVLLIKFENLLTEVEFEDWEVLKSDSMSPSLLWRQLAYKYGLT